MYFYINNQNKQSGPVSADKLRELGVSADTYVWKSGMAQWTKAGDVEELQPLFCIQPRKFPTVIVDDIPNSTRRSGNSIVFVSLAVILFSVLVGLMIAIIMIVNNKRQEQIKANEQYKIIYTSDPDTITSAHQTIEYIK